MPSATKPDRGLGLGLSGLVSRKMSRESGVLAFAPAAIATVAKVATVATKVATVASKAAPFLQAGGALLSARGSLKQGQAERDAAEAEAAQMDQRADAERAAGTYESNRILDRTREILSTQRARLASGGGGVDDGTGLTLASETVRKSSMEQLLTMAQAEDSARQDNWAADMRRLQGRQAQSARRLQATSTLLQAAGSWASRYGGPRANPGVSDNIHNDSGIWSKG